jgi:hypothetical protein
VHAARCAPVPNQRDSRVAAGRRCLLRTSATRAARWQAMRMLAPTLRNVLPRCAPAGPAAVTHSTETTQGSLLASCFARSTCQLPYKAVTPFCNVCCVRRLVGRAAKQQAGQCQPHPTAHASQRPQRGKRHPAPQPRCHSQLAHTVRICPVLVGLHVQTTRLGCLSHGPCCCWCSLQICSIALLKLYKSLHRACITLTCSQHQGPGAR